MNKESVPHEGGSSSSSPLFASAPSPPPPRAFRKLITSDAGPPPPIMLHEGSPVESKGREGDKGLLRCSRVRASSFRLSRVTPAHSRVTFNFATSYN